MQTAILTTYLVDNRIIAVGFALGDSQGNLRRDSEDISCVIGEFEHEIPGTASFASFEGTVVGCGIDFHTRTSFFTFNGILESTGMYYYWQLLMILRSYRSPALTKMSVGPFQSAWNRHDEIYPVIAGFGSAGAQLRTRFSPESSFVYQRP